MKWKKAALIQPQITSQQLKPKNLIVNTNTTDEMVICEEIGLKCVMPSASTQTKNPRKTNKKAEARHQLEIDEETGLKTTIEKTKTGNSKTTNNSNKPSRTLESKADNSLAKAVPAKSQKEHEGKNEAQNGTKSQNTKKAFQLNDTEQQLTACKAEVIRLETMVTEKEKKLSQLSKGDCCLANMILQHNPKKEMTLQKWS